MSTTSTLQSFVEQFLDERHRLGFASRSMGHRAALRHLCRCAGADWAATYRGHGQSGRAVPKTPATIPSLGHETKILRPFARWFRQFES